MFLIYKIENFYCIINKNNKQIVAKFVDFKNAINYIKQNKNSNIKLVDKDIYNQQLQKNNSSLFIKQLSDINEKLEKIQENKKEIWNEVYLVKANYDKYNKLIGLERTNVSDLVFNNDNLNLENLSKSHLKNENKNKTEIIDIVSSSNLKPLSFQKELIDSKLIVNQNNQPNKNDYLNQKNNFIHMHDKSNFFNSKKEEIFNNEIEKISKNKITKSSIIILFFILWLIILIIVFQVYFVKFFESRQEINFEKKLIELTYKEEKDLEENNSNIDNKNRSYKIKYNKRIVGLYCTNIGNYNEFVRLNILANEKEIFIQAKKVVDIPIVLIFRALNSLQKEEIKINILPKEKEIVWKDIKKQTDYFIYNHKYTLSSVNVEEGPGIPNRPPIKYEYREKPLKVYYNNEIENIVWKNKEYFDDFLTIDVTKKDNKGKYIEILMNMNLELNGINWFNRSKPILKFKGDATEEKKLYLNIVDRRESNSNIDTLLGLKNFFKKDRWNMYYIELSKNFFKNEWIKKSFETYGLYQFELNFDDKDKKGTEKLKYRNVVVKPLSNLFNINDNDSKYINSSLFFDTVQNYYGRKYLRFALSIYRQSLRANPNNDDIKKAEYTEKIYKELEENKRVLDYRFKLYTDIAKNYDVIRIIWNAEV